MKKGFRRCHHVWMIPAAAAFIAVFTCAVMLLWNALLPGIAGLPAIGFWQAAGLLVLSRILFGGLGGMGWHQGHKNAFKEKWLNMNDEERKAFVMKYHGFHHHRHAGACGEDGGQAGSGSDDQQKD
jgi:hypothetical protein